MCGLQKKTFKRSFTNSVSPLPSLGIKDKKAFWHYKKFTKGILNTKNIKWEQKTDGKNGGNGGKSKKKKEMTTGRNEMKDKLKNDFFCLFQLLI